MKYPLGWILSIGLFVLYLSGIAVADLYIESEQVSRGVPGRPDGAAVLKQYFDEDRLMLDLGDRLTVMNFKDGLFYEMDKAGRTYVIGRLDKMGLESIGFPTQGLERNALVNSLLQAVLQSAEVTPTRETRTVAGYLCKKFGVRLLMTQSVYWTTREIEGYPEIRALAEKAAAAFEKNPLLDHMNILGLIRELDGYPVHAVTHLPGGGSIATTLKTVQSTNFDPKLFKVPRGFTLIRRPG